MQIKMHKKEGLEMSFAWIFAILAGSVIIFLAVYATTNLISSTRYETNTKTAAQLDILFNPIETSLESGKFVEIEFVDETRVYNYCNEEGIFGRQEVRTSTRSGIGREWESPGAPIASKDKYILSERVIESETIRAFSKPINLPYKVADSIIIYSSEYCFIRPTSSIEDEVKRIGLPGITINSSVRYCPRESIKVCFFGTESECDINVYEGSVNKDGKVMHYIDDVTLFGAIFSDPEIYECQIKRVMQRNAELAELYASKSDFLTLKGCSSNLGANLRSFSLALGEFDNSIKIKTISVLAEDIERKNEILNCKLF